jgi:hypothetical protein
MRMDLDVVVIGMDGGDEEVAGAWLGPAGPRTG